MAAATIAPAAESTRVEQIISNFYAKALHIVLHSRIPHLVPHRPRDPRPTKRDRWFNLAVGDHPAILETLNFWNRCDGGSDPMVVDIVLSGPSDDASVLERWVVEYRRSSSGSGSGADVYATYKKGIVLLRSMYSMLRLLPAYKAYRVLSSTTQNYSFSLTYKVCSFTEPFERAEEEKMKQHCFGPVDTQFGHIAVSVLYRRNLQEFDLEGSPLMLPRIISDYVGSPAADPLRAFPSSLRSSSFPLRDSDFGAVQSTRPHSWTSNPMKHHPLSQGSQHNATSPSNFVGRQYLAAHHLQRTTSCVTRKGGSDIFGEHKLSPPFSPSPTPSPPLHPNSPLRGRMLSETAPMSIPLSSKVSLPPPSPRHTRTIPASGDSPSEGRSHRKTEGFQFSDIYSNITISPSQKGLRDGKDDVGHFSGIFSSCGSPRIGFSRSSSRLSSQDFADDSELFCHFELDDIDTSDSQNRNNDGKEALRSTQPYMSSRKSQDAAAGVLVQMLKSAPPLRHDSSSSQSTKSELGGDLGSSSFYSSRKTSDALEELRSYKEMKDMLLSRSGSEALNSSRQTQE